MKYICVLLVGVSFLSACTATNLQEGTGSEITPQAATGAQVIDLISKISMDIVENPTFYTCLESNVDMCIQQSGVMSGKEISCDSYILESNRKSCERNKTVALAVSTKDVKLCAGITEGGQSCEFEVLTSLALESLDASLCSTLTGTLQSSCNNRVVVSKAVKEKDVKLCDSLILTSSGNTFEKDMCIQQVDFMQKSAGLQKAVTE